MVAPKYGPGAARRAATSFFLHERNNRAQIGCCAAQPIAKDASRRKFDIVMSWAIDRVGRSLSDLLDGSCEPEKRKKVTPITDAAVLPLYPSRLDTDLGGGQS